MIIYATGSFVFMRARSSTSGVVYQRYAFTLIELAVVIMILGILAVIAVPRVLDTSHHAVDNSLRQSLGVIRTAIDTYAATNAGKIPGADGQQQTLKNDLRDFLRGTEFPRCPVGAAANDQVRMLSGTGAISAGIGATETTHSWVYQYESGSFYVNSNAVSCDDVTTYDQF